MKGLVLSGGIGKRLRPITYSMPKQLIPVANKPVLVHVLDRVRAMGVTEVGIVVGEEGAAQIAAEIGEATGPGLSITYLKQQAPLGLAHGVAIAKDFLGDDDFVMYLGDCLLGERIVEQARDFAARRPAAHVVVAKVVDPRGYGVVQLDADGSLLSLEEKPDQPRGELALTGVYFFTPAIHQAVASIGPGARGEVEITDAVQWLLGTGARVVARQFDGPYVNVDRIPDVLEANRKVLDDVRPSVAGQVDGHSEIVGPVVVERGARVVRSQVEGPVIIGAGTLIEDSYLGPHTSISRACAVRASGLEYSILMEEATVHDVRGLRGSIIGRSATVSGAADRNRLLVGDDCRVEV